MTPALTSGQVLTQTQTILMQIPTGAIGIITLLIAIYLTNLIKTRFIIIAFLCLPAIAGACGLIYIGRDNVRGLMGCYYVCYLFATLRELALGSEGYFPARRH
jgi:hypothetical protein